MNIEDEILMRARRIVRLEDQRARIAARLEKEQSEYHALVAKVAQHVAARADSYPLRHRILEFLQGQLNMTSLRKIQIAVRESGDKVIWTLANLKRAGFVVNPKRGYWQLNPHGPGGPETNREPEEDVGF
jgi:restriction endonuclease Mrr